MSSPHTPRSDSELRALLEQIAATAGDPPEHGLERIATLRRRRTRHRRRAVATTMALAVIAAATLTWTNLGERNNDVSAASETDGDKGPSEPPDRLDVRCDAEGIHIPVATIRPETDGLHIHVVNDSAGPVEVEVVEVPTTTGGRWESGPVEVDALDEESFVQPVPPGAVTIGCRAGEETDGDGEDTWERLQVFMVDPHDYYSEPSLECPTSAQTSPEEELPEHAATDDYTAVVEAALADYWDEETDEVAPLEAYPDQTFDLPALHPEVQVLRDGDPVAFARLEGDGSGPWESVAELTACDSFLELDDEGEEDDEAADDEAADDEAEGDDEAADDEAEGDDEAGDSGAT